MTAREELGEEGRGQIGMKSQVEGGYLRSLEWWWDCKLLILKLSWFGTILGGANVMGEMEVRVMMWVG